MAAAVAAGSSTSLPPLARHASSEEAGDPLGFRTGLRRLHVSRTGRKPLDGSTPDAIHPTIQAALDAARPGDVITVAQGVYRERPLISDKPGRSSLPIWIAAEERGAVTISDTWREAEEGETIWTRAGGGVYFAQHGARPYIGEHDGDFLMAYLSRQDLEASAITAYSAATRKEEVVKKPPYGFAFAPEERRVYIRLRDGVDPNGRAIKLTNELGRHTLTVKRSSSLIIDGFVLEGAGGTQAIHFDDACQDMTVRNCVFRLAKHGVRCPSNTLLDTCTYHYVGFGRWARDLAALNGPRTNSLFALLKGYYVAASVGAGEKGNALLEGSLEFGYNFREAPTNITVDNCLIGPCFDGSRIGEFDDSEIKHTVFLECRDDGFQNEGVCVPGRGVRASLIEARS